jgi:DNA-binding transcriptional MerR regulator
VTLLKIGELAKRAGLTVRALHHYDAIGLLSPSLRTASGSRRYGKLDLVRLHRVQALKQLGYSLTEIRAALEDPNLNPLELIERQVRALEEQERQARQLSERLRDLSQQISSMGEVAAADWLDLLEMMAIYRRYLTDDEFQVLRNPKNTAPRHIDAQWAELIDLVEKAMREDVPTQSAQAQAMAWRWVRLVIAMTGNNPKLAAKLMTIQVTEERARDLVRIGPDKILWIGEAFAHARTTLFAKYLTPEETAEVRRRQLAHRSHMTDWPSLVALLRDQFDAGIAVDAEPVLELAGRWQQLFLDSYCGENEVLEAKVREAFRQEPDLRTGVGIDEELLTYVRSALAHLPSREQQNGATRRRFG